MEIGPVSNVRPVPAIKPKAPELELSAVFDIEYSSRTGDETYSPNRGKSSAGQDDATEEDGVFVQSGASLAETGAVQASPRAGSQISFIV